MVVEQYMHRAPIFALEDAKDAREFGRWFDENRAAIREAAEATRRTGKLIYIGQYAVGPLRYLLFDYIRSRRAGSSSG